MRNKRRALKRKAVMNLKTFEENLGTIIRLFQRSKVGQSHNLKEQVNHWARISISDKAIPQE
jgi:hypothetical protein